jgi:hypothetical protein
MKLETTLSNRLTSLKLTRQQNNWYTIKATPEQAISLRHSRSFLIPTMAVKKILECKDSKVVILKHSNWDKLSHSPIIKTT